MKIGILTFHRCINYGSFWQTKCLAEGLQASGHEVYVLDHQSRRVNLAEWRCAMQPVLPTIAPHSDTGLYKKKIKKFFEAFETLPLSAPFSLEDPWQMDEYDLVVVGSDEVWNLSHPWYGHYPMFFGEGIRAKKLISYAASFGNYDESWKIWGDWAKRLTKFDHISVRDENSRMIIKNTLGFDPEVVLDPCLQFPTKLREQDAAVARKPYIAVYGHNFSVDFIKKIKTFAADKRYSLVSIGYRNDWADEQWLTAGPFDFLAFIKQARAVVSNFFHGCIFSILFSKPFASESSSYRNLKLLDILKRVNAENHLVLATTTKKELFNLLENSPEETIYNNLACFREISNDFLERAMIYEGLNQYEMSESFNIPVRENFE